MNPIPRTCPDCGSVLPADSPLGLCAACLLRELPGEAGPDLEATPRREEGTGDLVGRYKLLQKIGEGGFGTVWMADQIEPIRRRVAVKIVKIGMDTDAVIARFDAERQALAMMDHPNIARVFDAGATPTGRPFFVMELVRGVPITNYCDEHQLSTTERLHLFAQVCHAVQHAHQKGIIHRDLKPSNLLVTMHDGSPMPKVIDFGIAKATRGQLTDKTVFTAFEQFVGTPAYMSPEQAELSGIDIDTRSDIYSLGVLLYELLTGKPPFEPKELAEAGFDEIRRIIREVEAPKPSTRLSTLSDADRTALAKLHGTDPGKLSLLLRGDLDWIAMRCLEKDRTRRYETASNLVADIVRHLRNEPVTARPPSLAYLLQKFIRRNRLACIAGAAVAVALIGGLGVSIWEYLQERAARERAVAAEREQATQRQLAERARVRAETAEVEQSNLRQRAEAEEKKAETEAARSAQVAQFMKAMLNGVGPHVALGRDTKLLRDIMDDTLKRVARDLGGQPEVEVDLLKTIAKVYEDLGDHGRAVALRQETLVKVRKIHGNEHSAVAAELDSLGKVLAQVGKFADAEAAYREALTIHLNLKDTGDVTSRYGLVGLYWRQGRLGAAEDLCRQMIATARQRHSDESRELGNALVELGYTLHNRGKEDEAEATLREALAMMRRLFGNDSGHTLGALNGLGLLLTSERRFVEAEPIIRQRLAVARKGHGGDFADEGVYLSSLAGVLLHQGKLAEAEAMYRTAAASRAKFFGETHPTFAASLNSLGNVLMARGQWSEAEAVFQRALAIYRNLNVDPSIADSLDCIAQVTERQGRFAEAELAYRDELEVRHRIYGGVRSEVVYLLVNISRVLRAQGKLAEAEANDRDAAAARERLSRERSPSDERGLDHAASQGYRLAAERKYVEAEAAYRQELVQLRQQEGEESPRVAETLQGLGRVLQSQGKLLEAEEVLRLAQSIWIKATGAEDINTLHNLGYVLLAEGKLEESEPFLRRALDRLKTNPHSSLIATYGALAGLLRRQKKDAAVEALWRDAVDFARRRYGPVSQDVADFSASLLSTLVAREKFPEAETIARELLTITEKLTPGDWRTHAARGQLGQVLAAERKFAEAEPLLLAAYESLKSGPSVAEKSALGEIYYALNGLYAVTGRENPLRQPARLAELEAVDRQIVEFVRQRYGPGSGELSSAARELALVLISEGKFAEAETLARECVALRQKLLPPNDWRIAMGLAVVGYSLNGQKRYAEAEPLLLSAYADLKHYGPTTTSLSQAATLRQVARVLTDLYTATNDQIKATEWSRTVELLKAAEAARVVPAPPPAAK